MLSGFSAKNEDSWGEEESEDDEPLINYPQMPYGYPAPMPTPGYPTMPFFMYPMMLPPQVPPRKQKGSSDEYNFPPLLTPTNM